MQSAVSYFSVSAVFGKYPSVSEAKLYGENKPRDICRVVGLSFTLAGKCKSIAALFFISE